MGTKLAKCQACGGKGEKIVVKISKDCRDSEIVTCHKCHGTGRAYK